MFMGQYNQKVDTKGRAVVPAKFRDELGDQFVVTKGLDDCIFGFTLDKWEELVSKLSNLAITDKNVRAFSRFFLGAASVLETDKQGRVLLSQPLRTFASLESEVVWIGTGSRIEIWNPDKLNENTEYNEGDMEALAEYMSQLGI